MGNTCGGAPHSTTRLGPQGETRGLKPWTKKIKVLTFPSPSKNLDAWRPRGMATVGRGIAALSVSVARANVLGNLGLQGSTLQSRRRPRVDPRRRRVGAGPLEG